MSDLELLGLTVRTRNVLACENIFAAGQLVNMTHIDLLKIPNMGKKSAQEIADALSARGLSLKAYGCSKENRAVTQPSVEWSAFPALTLRDYFAAEFASAQTTATSADSNFINADYVIPKTGETVAQKVARTAYALADAMLAERSK